PPGAPAACRPGGAGERGTCRASAFLDREKPAGRKAGSGDRPAPTVAAHNGDPPHAGRPTALL
ncbi:hypothetical protein, partial [Nocardiopsis chromatogenes]|uniref:hypothetical protein n=1 Tax=Nocardiopsis chromatogenes TaxID=280239 RepID=UPI00195522E1